MSAPGTPPKERLRRREVRTAKGFRDELRGKTDLVPAAHRAARRRGRGHPGRARCASFPRAALRLARRLACARHPARCRSCLPARARDRAAASLAVRGGSTSPHRQAASRTGTASGGLLLVALAVAPSLAARPAVYRLDPVHTQITFFVDHLGFSRASGRAYGSEGALLFDPEDWSRSCAIVRIPVERIGFGDPRWDARMRKRDFFAMEEHPWIEFRGLWLERTGEREGILHGLLRLRGRGAPVKLDVRLNRIGYNPYAGRRAVGFSARGTLSRRAFGMDALPRQIGDEVELIIEVEALREPPRALRHPPCQPQTAKDQAHAAHP